MVLLRTLLSDDERDMVEKMQAKMSRRKRLDDLLEAYHEGSVRISQLGLAIPPNLWVLETLVNWPRVQVSEISNRMRIRSIMRPDEVIADAALMEGFRANNLASEAPLNHTQTMVYGRGFVSVGTNEEDPEHPLILIESPRESSCLINTRQRRMDAYMRTFRADNGDALGTLILPNKTLQISLGVHGWQIDEVGDDTGIDEHELGRVPVVMFLNRRKAGQWDGESEMTDVIPITDAAARALTNLQFALETHATPQKWALGVDQKDFVNERGEPIPAWESYMHSVWSTKNDKAKFGNFTPSDLRNFHETVSLYGEMASSVTGLPLRYFGKNTANPAAEGAIRADEARMINNAENKMVDNGASWSWVASLYERFRTGEWLPGNQITVEWYNAATPTTAEQADAIQKLNGGTPVYSREGSWDEMGWSEPRKNREREYFEKQEADPVFDRLNRDLGNIPRRTSVIPADDDAAATVS
ncbi:phage portal protein [Rhodococcus sp. 05-339-2]|uniref:phage portal protein n=1 Tax=Rhodococcoides fascians TaxID=1828 RepID=UPI0009E9A88A|nr:MULTISPECIES: phage portal protein [Rhodococcus]OZD75193.1 phage portal protein [Rhodococcus sp. 05-339-2]